MTDPSSEATMAGRSGEATLIHAFVAITDILTGTYDIADLLHTLLLECTKLAAVDAGAIFIIDSSGELQLVASTSEKSGLLQILKIDVGSGPCADCFDSGRVVVVQDLGEDDGRWPEFRAASLEVGFRSIHAVPLTLRGETIGAMVLFNKNIGTLSVLDASLAQALAAVATLGILHERTVRESSAVTAQLQRALDSRILIEQAKGMLAASTAIGVDDAFAAMRSFARSNNLNIHDVARQVIDQTLDIEVLAFDPKPRSVAGHHQAGTTRRRAGPEEHGPADHERG